MVVVKLARRNQHMKPRMALGLQTRHPSFQS
jgi:hypothetical protein